VRIAKMPTEEALMKKIDVILDASTARVTPDAIHLLLSTSFRLRVRSVPALRRFLAGNPSKYVLALNGVHRVAIPEPLGSSSGSSIKSMDSAASHTLKMDKVVDLGNMEQQLPVPKKISSTSPSAASPVPAISIPKGTVFYQSYSYFSCIIFSDPTTTLSAEYSADNCP
jgi:hypothetical protein